MWQSPAIFFYSLLHQAISACCRNQRFPEQKVASYEAYPTRTTQSEPRLENLICGCFLSTRVE